MAVSSKFRITDKMGKKFEICPHNEFEENQSTSSNYKLPQGRQTDSIPKTILLGSEDHFKTDISAKKTDDNFLTSSHNSPILRKYEKVIVVTFK